MNLKEINALEAIQLTPREIVILKLSLSMSDNAISKKLGLSRQRVGKIIEAAQRKVQEQIALEAEAETLDTGLVLDKDDPLL